MLIRVLEILVTFVQCGLRKFTTNPILNMRSPRNKLSTANGDSIYHCTSEAVIGEFIFDDQAKEVFCYQLRIIADYSGVQILTYAILSNHFHLLVRVPALAPVSDEELLRRYTVLYRNSTNTQQPSVKVVQSWFERKDSQIEVWRKQQLVRMGDISQFMKLLKQSFSIWYNKKHNRIGTLWGKRFTSSLVDTTPKAIQPRNVDGRDSYRLSC